jgi:hypothetical protein
MSVRWTVAIFTLTALLGSASGGIYTYSVHDYAITVCTVLGWIDSKYEKKFKERNPGE